MLKGVLYRDLVILFTVVACSSMATVDIGMYVGMYNDQLVEGDDELMQS